MKQPELMTFGEFIRSMRIEAKLPLRMVAAQLDIDPSLLGRIERNERPPTKEIIVGIAKIFEQDLKKLTDESLSDKIAYKILSENADINVLKVAEKKVEYWKNKQQ
ncbi:MAG: helix-turn-helix transcriptional regulator [Bacteroidota bacterium]